MTVGYSTSAARLNAIQAPQAQSHHQWPAEPMIHSISAPIGSPMAAPTSRPFAMSSR